MSEHVETNFNPPDLKPYHPSAYKGDSPPRRDLIEGRLPRGKLVLLAGQGDVGKSWLLLQLFEAVSRGEGEAFGGKVIGGPQPCVLIMGEDDREQADLRLAAIRRFNHSEPIPEQDGLILPAPNIGYMPLVGRSSTWEIEPTGVMQWLDKVIGKLKAWNGSMGFVGIDTFSTLCPVDANKADEVQAVWAHLSALATRHDVTVIVTHHFNKSGGNDQRASIRGSTALVDGVRAAYAMNKLDPDEAHLLSQGADLPESTEMVRLSLVKNNLGLKREPITLARLSSGVLTDISTKVVPGMHTPEMAMLRVITELTEGGQRVTKTGDHGIYKLRSSAWPKVLKDLGRSKLEALVQGLLDSGSLRADKQEGLVPT